MIANSAWSGHRSRHGDGPRLHALFPHRYISNRRPGAITHRCQRRQRRTDSGFLMDNALFPQAGEPNGAQFRELGHFSTVRPVMFVTFMIDLPCFHPSSTANTFDLCSSRDASAAKLEVRTERSAIAYPQRARPSAHCAHCAPRRHSMRCGGRTPPPPALPRRSVLPEALVHVTDAHSGYRPDDGDHSSNDHEAVPCAAPF